MTLTILEDTSDSLFLQLSGPLDVAGVREIDTRFLRLHDSDHPASRR